MNGQARAKVPRVAAHPSAVGRPRREASCGGLMTIEVAEVSAIHVPSPRSWVSIDATCVWSVMTCSLVANVSIRLLILAMSHRNSCKALLDDRRERIDLVIDRNLL